MWCLTGSGPAERSRPVAAGSCLTSEGCLGQQLTGTRPEITYMCAAVCLCLVEPDTRHVARSVGLELGADLDSVSVTRVDSGGRRRGREHLAGAVDIDGYSGRWCLDIAAVIGCPRPMVTGPSPLTPQL